jgi:hypothetical protein
MLRGFPNSGNRKLDWAIVLVGLFLKRQLGQTSICGNRV